MGKLNGGYPTYGADMGVLMLDCRFPRPKGDIGNAASFPYPVCYEIIERVEASGLTTTNEQSSVEQMLHHAQALEQRGVRAMLTSCGLLITHQEKLARRLSVPVVSSCLTLLPFVRSIINPEKRIAVIVSALSGGVQQLLAQAEGQNVMPISMESSPEFMRGIMSMRPPYELDPDKLEAETVEICRRALEEYGNIGAILVECTNIAPYSAALRREFRIPVFDIIQVAELLHTAVSTQ